MMKPIWDEHYRVGIEPMDNQHRVIFGHILREDIPYGEFKRDH